MQWKMPIEKRRSLFHTYDDKTSSICSISLTVGTALAMPLHTTTNVFEQQLNICTTMTIANTCTVNGRQEEKRIEIHGATDAKKVTRTNEFGFCV